MDRFLFCKKFQKSYIFLSAMIIFADIVSKKTVKLILNQQDYQYLKITKYLNFVSAKNTGIAFGIFHNNSFLSKGANFVNFFLLIYILRLFTKTTTTVKKVALSMIFSGGVSNLIDKVTAGYVFDFLDLHLQGYHWYTFNLADIFVCTGSFLFFISELGFLNRTNEGR